VHIYESNEALEATQRFYDSWMSEHGYRATRATELGASSYLRSDGSQIFLSLLREGSHTFVTVTDSEQGDTSATLRLGGEP
jgi:S1-C subfamily serine protease